jgi:hypothetical protein
MPSRGSTTSAPSFVLRPSTRKCKILMIMLPRTLTRLVAMVELLVSRIQVLKGRLRSSVMPTGVLASVWTTLDTSNAMAQVPLLVTQWKWRQ